MTLDPAVLGHLADDGTPCTEHVATPDAILMLAAIGSRVSSFNHDIASKLQGVMMALDEIAELIENRGGVDLQRATETAQGALKEATVLLSANRALTRTSTSARVKVELRDVVEGASARFGIAMRGGIPEGQLEATVPLLVQGLGLALDAIAGAARGRALDIAATRDLDRATLVFTSAEPPSTNAGDSLALAAFVIARAGGELRCGGGGRLTISLPLSPAP